MQWNAKNKTDSFIFTIHEVLIENVLWVRLQNRYVCNIHQCSYNLQFIQLIQMRQNVICSAIAPLLENLCHSIQRSQSVRIKAFLLLYFIIYILDVHWWTEVSLMAFLFWAAWIQLSAVLFKLLVQRVGGMFVLTPYNFLTSNSVHFHYIRECQIVGK